MTDPTERTKDMTVTDTVPRNGSPLKDLPPAVQREEARRMARADGTLKGPALGERFGYGARWGRLRIAEAAEPEGSGTPAERNGTGAERAALVPIPTARPATMTKPVNGTTHTPTVAPVRPSKPVQRKPAAEVAEPLPQPSQALVVVSKLAVAVVAAVAAVVSYSHTRDLALAVGQNPTLASLLPFSVDGLVVVGSTSLLIDRQSGRVSSGWAMLAVTIGLAASLAANVVSVDPTVVDERTVRWVMAAYAPVALAIAMHLILRMPTQPQANNRKDTP